LAAASLGLGRFGSAIVFGADSSAGSEALSPQKCDVRRPAGNRLFAARNRRKPRRRLQRGGNAVDDAVAAILVLFVIEAVDDGARRLRRQFRDVRFEQIIKNKIIKYYCTQNDTQKEGTRRGRQHINSLFSSVR